MPKKLAARKNRVAAPAEHQLGRKPRLSGWRRLKKNLVDSIKDARKIVAELKPLLVDIAILVLLAAELIRIVFLKVLES